MLHGAVENGRVFYSKSGKGLAPYLAKMGFDVYIGEFRGKGSSTPPISPYSTYGQTEVIKEDILLSSITLLGYVALVINIGLGIPGVESYFPLIMLVFLLIGIWLSLWSISPPNAVLQLLMYGVFFMLIYIGKWLRHFALNF